MVKRCCGQIVMEKKKQQQQQEENVFLIVRLFSKQYMFKKYRPVFKNHMGRFLKNNTCMFSKQYMLILLVQ